MLASLMIVLKPVVALNQMIETLSRDTALAIQRLASRVVARGWEAAQGERGTKPYRVVRLLIGEWWRF
jgi:hypothetical protein